MNSNTKSKRTVRIALTGVVIAVVTLALVTTAIVVSMVPTIVQTAYASCITTAKGIACSGGGCNAHPGSCSLSLAGRSVASAISEPSGSKSVIVTPTGAEHLSTSHNFAGLGNCAFNNELL